MSNKRLEIITDNANWSFYEDSKFMAMIFDEIIKDENFLKIINKFGFQYFVDRYKFFYKTIHKHKCIQCLDYYHGEPRDGKIYKKFFSKLKKYSKNLSLIRVPNKKIYNAMYDYGINYENNISILPIPVNSNIFSKKDSIFKDKIRKDLKIPNSLFIIGSFQKDGVGWDQGFEPKLIKGPDIFLKSIESLISLNKNYKKNIGILLSGPARGYIKNGLEKLNIKYWHVYCKNLEEVSHLYNAADAYFISSRLEGGPKSFLESVSSKIPIISTPVGQVFDLYNESSLMGKTFSAEEYGNLLNNLIQNYQIHKDNCDYYYKKLITLYSFKEQRKIWLFKLKDLLFKFKV